jgi:hypothetical protein
MLREATPERLTLFSDAVFAVVATLCLFAAAAVVALKYPRVGLGICICCLMLYLKPDAPGAEGRIFRSPPR